jgi:squalene-associated FAD-dependent desaturase
VSTRRVAVLGGGWAGLAAAVTAVGRGHAVTLYEMAAQLGGRARTLAVDGHALDNGQHILIGAYVRTLELMRRVGAPVDSLLLRAPLQLIDPTGGGLRLPAGRPIPAFVRGVLGHAGWSLADRLALLRAASGWALRGFRCASETTVAQLTAGLAPTLRDELIEPLCVAALNTPAAEASGAVFLRVLRDALFSGPGSADLLLPRASLSALLPEPAEHWLSEAGARLHLAHRVRSLERDDVRAWRVDGVRHDRVVLATPPGEAARLVRPWSPGWAARAEALRYEPIVTVYAMSPGARLVGPMVSLPADGTGPAQFVFDHGQLGGPAGLLAFVISGARPWVERGLTATEQAVLAQGRRTLGAAWSAQARAVRTLGEKRATFRCTPALDRPEAVILPGLAAAGDHVQGPYPATLEGAVRSGLAAVRLTAPLAAMQS